MHGNPGASAESYGWRFPIGRDMHSRSGLFWRLLTNPAFEVILAIAVVLLATWILIDTDTLQGNESHVPALFGRK